MTCALFAGVGQSHAGEFRECDFRGLFESHDKAMEHVWSRKTPGIWAFVTDVQIPTGMQWLDEILRSEIPPPERKA
jgi:hypothetical protein